MSKYIGFAGTYTRQTSEGIYRFELDTVQGALKNCELATKVSNPTYLSIAENNQFLYSVAQEENLGGIYAYKVNQESSALTKIDAQLTDGAPPCHVNVYGNKLVTSNYHQGTVGTFHVNEEQGTVSKGSFVTHTGNGPHKRQEKPHVHYAGFSPDENYIFACDLGTDEVVTYKVEDKELHRIATLKVKAGSGPRHLTFHPNGKYAYLLTELSSEVVVLAYDKEKGTFEEKQYIKTIPDSFTETNDASAIQISSDGRFVYTGNRGHNSVAIFQVNEQTLELSFIEHVSSNGEWPRDFVLDPSESFLVVSNQHTENIVLFRRDIESGKLTETGSEIDVPEVVCLKFLSC